MSGRTLHDTDHNRQVIDDLISYVLVFDAISGLLRNRRLIRTFCDSDFQ